MPMSNKIEVTSSPVHGQGWRAKEDIMIGEVLWEEGPLDQEVFTHHEYELSTWPHEVRERLCGYQVDERVHRSPFGKDAVAPHEVVLSYYINHSCDGNMWYDAEGTKLIACKNIARGEELSYDYVLSQSSPDFVMNCRCYKEACRGVLSGNDYKKKDLQARYGGHFLPYILRKIEKEKSEEVRK